LSDYDGDDDDESGGDFDDLNGYCDFDGYHFLYLQLFNF